MGRMMGEQAVEQFLALATGFALAIVKTAPRNDAQHPNDGGEQVL